MVTSQELGDMFEEPGSLLWSLKEGTHTRYVETNILCFANACSIELIAWKRFAVPKTKIELDSHKDLL